MKLHVVDIPKLALQRRASAILGMIIIVMLWTGIIMKYFESKENDQREAQRTLQNFAMLFEENVLRSIGEIDKATSAMATGRWKWNMVVNGIANNGIITNIAASDRARIRGLRSTYKSSSGVAPSPKPKTVRMILTCNVRTTIC